MPALLEVEGNSQASIEEAADLLGLSIHEGKAWNWKQVREHYAQQEPEI